MSVGSVRTRRRATDAAQSASSFALSVSVLACSMFVVVTTEFVVVGLLPAIARDLSLSRGLVGFAGQSRRGRRHRAQHSRRRDDCRNRGMAYELCHDLARALDVSVIDLVRNSPRLGLQANPVDIRNFSSLCPRL